jgi:hypothetical protein
VWHPGPSAKLIRVSPFSVPGTPSIGPPPPKKVRLMMRLVAQTETPVEALSRMEAQLGRFSECFHAELHTLAGGKLSPYVNALARAALHAAGGTLALVAVPTGEKSVEANRLASVATSLLDYARAAATWEGVMRRPTTRRSGNSRLVASGLPSTPRGGSSAGAHHPKFATLSELASFIVKANQVPEFERLLDGVETDERAKAKPSRRVLRRIASARRKVRNRQISSAVVPVWWRR